MSTKTKTPPKAIVPPHLAELPAVSDAASELAEAIDRLEEARAQDDEARAALATAPADDERALDDAVAKGEPTPKPTAPERKAEAEAARRRLGSANALATRAGDALRSAIIEHRSELDAVQAPRVQAAADEVVEALDTLGAKLGVLAQEAGARRGLYVGRREPTAADERSRMMGRVPSAAVPTFDPVRHQAVEHITALREAVAGIIATPIAPPDKRAERRRARAERAERKAAEEQAIEERNAGRRERAERKSAA